ncbi:glucan biosynthesis protein D [Aureimonas sp. SA4125]|uniref:glucan biosynthesis protein n=1 Tax=Aureimonas sp. SA4125 TaxID=2826993 RepID=UPI001CC71752|nr:glucan biosynthesis protein [Aureimonas sp. SA4125]BDA82617.1 glucan biosynthesis protein D [Aureimonas sp. SA4125]
MLNRRALMMVLGAAALPLRPAQADLARANRGGAPMAFGEPQSFSWEALVAMAAAAHAAPYAPRPDPAPEALARIGYSQHGRIHQPVSAGLFAGAGRDGVVTMFHLGELFRRPVRIHMVEGGEAREILYRRDYFAFPEGSPAAAVPDDVGFGGFRVHEPERRPGQPGDWLAFLGASYFRSSGDLKQYGISARGLALETGAFDGADEEFPDFTDFWIEEMRGGVMRIHALLQGPSVTGAYRFDVTHFPETVMGVTCRLFLRRDIQRLGIAPMTSMYWYSQETRWAQGDFRPEVHDSDGLLIHDRRGGAIWRPLTNPPKLSFASFLTERPTGFGLMQRDRDYGSYEDAVGFERRPNLWVVPIEGFGKGSVQLVEFPTQSEYADNVVAFYVPEAPARAGDTLDFRYRLHWSGAEPPRRLAKLVAHRLGRPHRHFPPGVNPQPDRLERKIVLDYSGPELAGLRLARDNVAITLSHGTVHEIRVERAVDDALGWRVVFDAFTTTPDVCEAIVKLTVHGAPLAETVVFRFAPEDGLPSL